MKGSYHIITYLKRIFETFIWDVIHPVKTVGTSSVLLFLNDRIA